jgi:hypothetical protein
MKKNLEQVNMQKKLTINIDEKIYYGLCQFTDISKLNQLVENLLKLHLLKMDMHAAYKQMASDEERESEALEWAEATIGDSSNEAW